MPTCTTKLVEALKALGKDTKELRTILRLDRVRREKNLEWSEIATGNAAFVAKGVKPPTGKQVAEGIRAEIAAAKRLQEKQATPVDIYRVTIGEQPPKYVNRAWARGDALYIRMVQNGRYYTMKFTKDNYTFNGQYVREAEDYFKRLGSEGTTKGTGEFIPVNQLKYNNKAHMKVMAKWLNSKEVNPAGKEHMAYIEGLIDMINVDRLQETTVAYRMSNEGSYGEFQPGTGGISVSINTNKDITGYLDAASVYMHEVIHSLSYNALRALNGDPKQAALTKLLYDTVKNNQSMLAKNIRGYIANSKDPQEAAYLRRSLEYVFDNKNDAVMDEFIAHTLTHPVWMKAAKDVQIGTGKQATTLFEKVSELFKKMVDYILGVGTVSPKNKSMYDAVLTLTMELAEYNNKAKEEVAREQPLYMKLMDKVDDLNNAISDKIKAQLYKKLGRIPDASAGKVEVAKWWASAFMLSFHNPAYAGIRRSMMSDVLGLEAGGLIQNIIDDMTDNDEASELIEKLGLAATRIDTVRNAEKAAVKDYLESLLVNKLDKVKEEQLTRVVLELDLSVLNEGYDYDMITAMVSDKNVRKEEINKLKESLAAIIGRGEAYNLVVNDSKLLGYFLVTHKGSTALNLNAAAIAHAIDIKDLKAKEKLAAIADKLSTLYGLEYTPKRNLEVVKEVMVNESEFVKALMRNHATQKAEVLEQDFSGNHFSVLKGYTKELFDQSIDMQIKPLSMTDEMIKQGYRLVEELKKDPSDKSMGKKGMFVKKWYTGNSVNMGAIRTHQKLARGGSIVEQYRKEARGLPDRKLAKQQVKRNMLETHHVRATTRDMMTQKEMDVLDIMRESGSLIPVYDKRGGIIDYRYMMNKVNKQQHLGQDVRVLSVFPAMAGQALERVSNRDHNKEMVNALISIAKDDLLMGYKRYEGQNPYEVLAIPDRTGNSSNEYVYIGNTPENTSEERALYHKLPYEVKDYMRDGKYDSLPVRKDLLNAVMGFEHETISDIVIPLVGKAGVRVDPRLEQAMDVFDRVWKDFISLLKEAILIKTPKVAIDNFLSNFSLSIEYGASPLKVGKLTLAATKNVKDYMENKREYLRITAEIKSGNNANKNKLKILQESMERNPAHEIIEAGLFQSVVEDMLKERERETNIVSQKLKDVIPTAIRPLTNWVFITEETPLYRIMEASIQYSDLIARVTQNELMKEKGIDAEERIRYVKNAFVNYNKPSSKREEFLNKIGAVMFTKYIKRSQLALRQLVVGKPVNALLTMVGQHVWDTPNIHDSFLLSRGYGNLDFDLGRAMETTMVPPAVRLLGSDTRVSTSTYGYNHLVQPAQPVAKVTPEAGKATVDNTKKKASEEESEMSFEEMLKEGLYAQKEGTPEGFDPKLSEKIAKKLAKLYPEISVEYMEDSIAMKQALEDLGGNLQLFQLSKKRREEFKAKLNKARPELKDTAIEDILDKIGEFAEENYKDEPSQKKAELAALHWTLKGHVILPEDGSKIVQAIKLAKDKKLDIMKFDNPNDIINNYGTVAKDNEAVNPDTMIGKGFSNKKEYAEGVTVYDVDNNDVGRDASRLIIDTHYGTGISPWCLLAGSDTKDRKNDEAYQKSKTFWYENYPGEKKIAFKDGNLVAFYGGDRWWDKRDQPSPATHVPIIARIPNDKLKRNQYSHLDIENNKVIPDDSGITFRGLGNRDKGEYWEWHKDQLIFERRRKAEGWAEKEWYDNGVLQYELLPDGTERHWYESGQLTFEKLGTDNIEKQWHRNGQMAYEKHPDGTLKRWYDNGQPELEKFPDGSSKKWHPNGQMVFEKSSEGVIKEWNNQGQLMVEKLPDGTERRWSHAGKLVYERLPNKATREWYPNGQLWVEALPDKSRKEWYSNGTLKYETAVKTDGTIHTKKWDENGFPVSTQDVVAYYGPEGDVVKVRDLNDVRDDYDPDEDYDDYDPDDYDNDTPFQKSANNDVKGVAILAKNKILINKHLQSTDTLPHEYAHFYVRAFKDSTIVQEGIKKWGSEEKLVQSIGEQVVKQKGEARTWWKKFSDWVKSLFKGLGERGKEELTATLADGLLTRKDLGGKKDTTANEVMYQRVSLVNTPNMKYKEESLQALANQIRSSFAKATKVSSIVVGEGEVLSWGKLLTKTYTIADNVKDRYYEYSGIKHTMKNKAPQVIRNLAKDIEEATGKPAGYYNHVLVNEFLAGNNGLNFHRDNEALYEDDKGNVGDVAVLSIGKTKGKHEFKKSWTETPESMEATNGSVVVFNGSVYHKVPESEAGRISITFRHIPDNHISRNDSLDS